MKVETYEEISIDEQDGNIVDEQVSEEALALIGTLGLTGQQALIARKPVEGEDGEEIERRIPYREITAEEARFWSKVDRAGDCWLWCAAVGSHGYGVFRSNGKAVTAHRFAYQSTRGEIPPGLLVCHTCDNRRCVRPDHLFVGDVGDNNRDMVAKGRHWSANYTHCKRGHELTPDNTMTTRYQRRRCRTCALDYWRERDRRLRRERAAC